MCELGISVAVGIICLGPGWETWLLVLSYQSLSTPHFFVYLCRMIFIILEEYRMYCIVLSLRKQTIFLSF
jgi:hypothetical protein